MSHRRRRGALACLSLLLSISLTSCWSAADKSAGGDRGPRREQTSLDPTQVRYVSPGGRDKWRGTEAKPWRTLGRALPAMLAGQTLYVRGGVYRERLVKVGLRPAHESEPIVVRAYPGERPLVRGLMWLNEPRYWTFDGINVAWDPELSPPARHLLKLAGGVGWTWRNGEVWGARAPTNVLIVGTRPGQPKDWSFEANCIHDLDMPAAVQLGSNLAVGDMQGAGPGRIIRNLIFDEDLRGRNIRLGGGDSGSAATGPTDVAVAYNTVLGARVAVALAGSTSGVQVERNLLGRSKSGTVVRAGQLRGARNVVRHNLGIEAERFFRPGTGSLEPGPGNILLDKGEVGVRSGSGCDGFGPTTVASAYGRDAVG